jgi:hypothetical protein
VTGRQIRRRPRDKFVDATIVPTAPTRGRETRFGAGAADGMLFGVLNGFVAARGSGEQASLDATRAQTSARA